jgi:hypothetical protein
MVDSNTLTAQDCGDVSKPRATQLQLGLSFTKTWRRFAIEATTLHRNT